MEPPNQFPPPLQQHVHRPHTRILLLDLLSNEGEERMPVDRDDLIHEIFDLSVQEVHLIRALQTTTRATHVLLAAYTTHRLDAVQQQHLCTVFYEDLVVATSHHETLLEYRV